MVRTKKGFSLIELLVVIGLLSLLMLAISSTMLMSIISSNRIRTSTKVKQAGNYALGQIQAMIRNAKSISVCRDDISSTTFTNPDGGSTTILSESDGTNYRIASNSGVYLTPANLTVSSFSLNCLPFSTNPLTGETGTTLIKVSFDLKDQLTTSRTTENPLLHFETSVNLRNE